MFLNNMASGLPMKHIVALARGQIVEDSVCSVFDMLKMQVRGRVCILASRDLRRGFLSAISSALKACGGTVLVSNRGADHADCVIRVVGFDQSVTDDADFFIIDFADSDNLILAARNAESAEVVRRAVVKMMNGDQGSVWYGLKQIKRISDICLETRNVPESAAILACLQKGDLVFACQTKALKIQQITAQRSPSEWRPDPKGYFLIKIENNKIVAGYCTNNHVLTIQITGKDPLDLYYTVIRLGLVSSLQHAAYLGVEFQKAYEALRVGRKYVQDE